MTNDSIKYLQFGTIQNAIQTLALGTSTSETAFAVNGNSVANIAAKPAILSLPDTGTAAPFFWDNGKPFFIQGWGICTTGASTNLTLKLYQVPQSVISGLAVGSVTSCQLVATSTARAVNSTTGKFIFQAEFQWDSTTKLLHGQFTDQISNLLDAWAATTAVTTTAQDADLNFLFSATLSSGNAANQVQLMEAFAQAL